MSILILFLQKTADYQGISSGIPYHMSSFPHISRVLPREQSSQLTNRKCLPVISATPSSSGNTMSRTQGATTTTTSTSNYHHGGIFAPKHLSKDGPVNSLFPQACYTGFKHNEVNGAMMQGNAGNYNYPVFPLYPPAPYSQQNGQNEPKVMPHAQM